MKGLKIDQNTQVKLHFALMLEDGAVVDSTFNSDPAQLTLGDGNLPEHFEACLLGLEEGNQETFTLPPEKAFGQHNPSNVQRLPKASFEQDMENLQLGMIFGFNDPKGNEVPGVITNIEDKYVEVDFNHPLAGKTLQFKVEILAVEPATLH